MISWHWCILEKFGIIWRTMYTGNCVSFFEHWDEDSAWNIYFLLANQQANFKKGEEAIKTIIHCSKEKGNGLHLNIQEKLAIETSLQLRCHASCRSVFQYTYQRIIRHRKQQRIEKLKGLINQKEVFVCSIHLSVSNTSVCYLAKIAILLMNVTLTVGIMLSCVSLYLD